MVCRFCFLSVYLKIAINIREDLNYGNQEKISLTLVALLASSLAFSAFSQLVFAENGCSSFTDVKTSYWFFEYVLEPYDDDIMTGTYVNPSTGEREFSPKSPLAMVGWSVMLVRAYYAGELVTSTIEKLN